MVLTIKGEDRAKRILLGAYKNMRIPNAYIFSGQNIEEMCQTAKEYTKLLICGCNSNNECIICKNIDKEVHPDFISITADGKFIKIDQIRSLKDLIKYGPNSGNYLVVRIIGADAMNIEAANSFLKTLEEPNDKILFILITAKEDALPKTIISRCQKINFANPDSDVLNEKIGLLKKSDIRSALNFSKNLSECDSVEKNLYQLAKHYSKNHMPSYSLAVLDCVKALKKHANLKLALDVMSLRLSGNLNE